jgi:aromatic ring hydroxylase
MRRGADYRQSLRDGRRVWVMGEGLIDDVAAHLATRAMVDEYVAWYDRLADPAWADVVLTAAAGIGIPLAYVLPRNADDLVRMGRCFSATTFLSAGNIAHTPAYGHLISLGILAAVQDRNVSARQIADATAYRELIVRTGRFLTFSGGGATIGYRLRDDPRERAAFRITKATDAGLVISGKIGMHTSPAFAEDLFIGGQTGVEIGEHRATFIVPVGAPGVTTVCRKPAVRPANPFAAPLSSRYDELDGQMWLDKVFIPWERVFLLDVSPRTDRAVAALAPALLLAVEIGVHPRSGACLHARDGTNGARNDHRPPS